MTNEAFNRRGITTLLVEGVVVVASILVAFALDAWWADKKFEREVAEDLVILESELTENVRLAQAQVDMMTQIVVTTKALVNNLAAQPDLAMVEVSDAQLYWAIFVNPTFDPSLGGVDAWIAAGRMGGIDSPVLRQRLAGIRGLVEDSVEEQLIARRIGVDQIYPLIQNEVGDIGLVIKLFNEGFHMTQRTSIQTKPESGLVALPNLGALRFLLQARTIWYEAAIKELGDFQAKLDDIRQELRKEIT